MNGNCTMLYECDNNGDLQVINTECADNAACVRSDDFVTQCVCDEGYTGDGLVECEGLNIYTYKYYRQ